MRYQNKFGITDGIIINLKLCPDEYQSRFRIPLLPYKRPEISLMRIRELPLRLKIIKVIDVKKEITW